MHLETAQDIEHANVTEAQLREAFRDDKGRGEYIILDRGERKRGRGTEYYIQAGGEFDDRYILHHREGDKEHHFHADGKYTKAQVEQAFVWYLQNDGRWRTELPWVKVEVKP
jgi:hypothetical protein